MIAGRILTFCYFAYFLIVLPLLSRIETPRPVPNSIADDVLAKTGSKSAPMVSTVIALVVAGALFVGSAQNAARPKTSGNAAVAEMVVLRPVRQVRSRLAAARPEGLQGSLLGLPQPVLIAFRNLADPGGPGYSAAQAAAFASDYKVKDGPNDQGDMFERPGRPADYFPSPFPNEQAARAANGGAAPPDLSLITKARSYERGFPKFIFDFFTQSRSRARTTSRRCCRALRKSRRPASPSRRAPTTTILPGHAIKMPKPLSDGQVTFDDGSPATVAQYSKTSPRS